jgi:hypothetical protein
MNLFRVNFRELYQRHLCRHGQFGLNVEHLVTVVGTYLAILGMIYWVSGSTWWAPLLPVPLYLALLFPSLPPRLTAVLVLFLAVLFGLLFLMRFALPLPAWLNAFNVVIIFLLYKVQAIGHRVYTEEKDMTEFNRKYPKGISLFLLLSLYELPLLLNYLVFDKRSWSIGVTGAVSSS